MIFRIWLALLLCPVFLKANETAIIGRAPSLAGHEIRLTKLTDPFSGSLEVLDLDTINSEGKFELTFSPEEVTEVYLTINRFRAPIFASPGETYAVQIPEQAEFSLIPSWRPSGFEYLLENADSTDVNFKISSFDQRYFSFYNENAQFIGTSAMRRAISDFAAQIDSTNGFSGTYKTYSIAEMKLSAGFPKNELYAAYLKNAEIQLQNPAFKSFFDKFYADYFDQYDVRFGGATLANRFRKGLNYQGVDTLLLEDDFLQREDIRQWVILKSINENIYGKKYPAAALRDLLTELRQRAVTEEIQSAAHKIEKTFQEHENAVPLAELPFKKMPEPESKPTLLAIGHLNSKEYIKELSLLESLEKEYGEYFSVIQVFLPSEPGLEIPNQLISPANEYELITSLGIYALPWYGWVNGEGEIVEKELQKPSTGLEERLYRIRAKKREEDKIKIGQ